MLALSTFLIFSLFNLNNVFAFDDQFFEALAADSFGCDALKVAIKADAALRNDTCFLSDSNCEECTIDKHAETHAAGECAFCPNVTITYDGTVLGTDFSGKCHATEWCWKGGFFSFMSPVKTIEKDGNKINIQVWCDGLPNYRQCAVSGTFLVAGSATLIFLSCCCCVTLFTWCFCR